LESRSLLGDSTHGCFSFALAGQMKAPLNAPPKSEFLSLIITEFNDVIAIEQRT
jgi:hypothetical protein